MYDLGERIYEKKRIKEGKNGEKTKQKREKKHKIRERKKKEKKERQQKKCNYEFHVIKGEIIKMKMMINKSEWNEETQI